MLDYFETLDLNNLKRLQEKESYRFVMFDAGITCNDKSNLEDVLLCGRELVLTGDGMAEDSITLAKVTFRNKTALLYADRDYFSIILRISQYSDEMLRWQLAKDTRGMTINDLELLMSSFLVQPRKPQHQEPIPAPEYWKGEGPDLDLLFSDGVNDNLI